MEFKGLRYLKINEFDDFFKVLEESFPKIEYRSYEKQKALLDHPLYDIETYEEGGSLKGYISSWKFEEFNFVEHLAVNSDARGEGIGTKILESAKEKWRKPIYLEVELPENEICRKRIRFYERNGFTYNDHPYVQPPLMPGFEEIPLRIMSSNGPISMAEIVFIKEKMKDIVYIY